MVWPGQLIESDQIKQILKPNIVHLSDSLFTSSIGWWLISLSVKQTERVSSHVQFYDFPHLEKNGRFLK